MQYDSLFLNKCELEKVMGCSMRTAYKGGIFTEEIVQELGFESLEKFKNKKKFTLKETKALRNYLSQLLKS